MPSNLDERKKSPLWSGCGGTPNGPLADPRVAAELEEAIRNRNVVNVPALRAFCAHNQSEYVFRQFYRWKPYWDNPKGDVELFVESQGQEAIDAIARANSFSEAVRVVGSMRSTANSTLGVHLYDIRAFLKQPSLQVQTDTVLALVLLNPLREDKMNDLSNPDSSVTASELHKALADVAKASSVAARVETKVQCAPVHRRDVVP